MNALLTRYTELQAAGRVPLYCYKQATVTLAKADNVQIALGLQPNGRYLNLVDLDSHKVGQDAAAARAAFTAALPHVASKIEWHATPRGVHGLFETCKKLPTGRLYDANGSHIGELLNDGSHTRDHGDIAPRTLSLTEIDHMFLYWSVDGGENGGAQWKERAKEGAKLAAGYSRARVTKDELRAFLQKECGGVGATLNALFDERGLLDRSAAAGNLMQTLMYHARRMPGGESYRTVMAYWMAAGSYGKASDRDYNQEKDGCSLIAQIVHGDMKKNGKPWIPPFWVKGRTKIDNVNLCLEPEPAPPRPAHRPVGDQEKHLATLGRVLEVIEPDAFGRRTYTLAYLAERMKIARCAIAPRTCSRYLKLKRDRGEIVTAQIGGNGRPYAILIEKEACNGAQKPTEARAQERNIQSDRSIGTEPGCAAAGRGAADRDAPQRSIAAEASDTAEHPRHCAGMAAQNDGAAPGNGQHGVENGRNPARNDSPTTCFGDANNSQKRVETDLKPDTFGGADPIADERILTPQSTEQPHVCIGDHHKTSAPTAEPGGASYEPGRDWTAGGRLDLSSWRDPREMRVPAGPVDRASPPRYVRRQPRQQGQESFMGRGGAIAAKIARKKRHGAAPVPTPYRPRAQLVIESLPEPPAAAAPAGAQRGGAPLPGPQAGPAQRMAERRRREAQQVQR